MKSVLERGRDAHTHAREARALLIGRQAHALAKHAASMPTNATNTRFLNVPKIFLSEMHGGIQTNRKNVGVGLLALLVSHTLTVVIEA